MSKPTKLGSAIRQARKKANLSIDNLSAATGLTTSVIYRIEVGKIQNPTINTVLKLCNVLQIQIPNL